MADGAKVTKDSSLVGLQIGDSYRLVRLLGKGGMGHVYEAEHLRLPRRAAVKVVRRELAGNAELFERFKREAEVTSAIGNPHIVQVLDFNTLPDGSPYMVMELLKGEDLSQRLLRGPLSLPEAQEIVGQAADGLASAHALGVVHRDVKPANVFLTTLPNGRTVVKLLDFGVSKIRGSGLTGVHAMGTAWYMSPEQIRAAASVDSRADLYSLAVVLFECLSGRPPFDAETAFAAMDQVIHTPAPSILRWLPNASAGLDLALQRGMAKEASKRPGSVLDFWKEVEPELAASAAVGTDRTVKRPSLPDLDPPPDSAPRLELEGTFISEPRIPVAGVGSRPRLVPSGEAPEYADEPPTNPLQQVVEAAADKRGSGKGLSLVYAGAGLALVAAIIGMTWVFVSTSMKGSENLDRQDARRPTATAPPPETPRVATAPIPPASSPPVPQLAPPPSIPPPAVAVSPASPPAPIPPPVATVEPIKPVDSAGDKVGAEQPAPPAAARRASHPKKKPEPLMAKDL